MEKNIHSPSEFFSTPLHQWLCYVACQLTVSTSHIKFGFCGRVLPNLTSRIIRKSRLHTAGLGLMVCKSTYATKCVLNLDLSVACSCYRTTEIFCCLPSHPVLLLLPSKQFGKYREISLSFFFFNKT